MDRHIILNILETLLVAALLLWIIALFVSMLFKQHDDYLAWTKKTLGALWRKEKKLIIGIALGYWLSGNPFLEFV